MKKFFAILLALCMIVTMSVTAFAAENKTTDITYNASENGGVDNSTWTVTVPATLTAGTAGEVKAEGSWAPSDILSVTADENVNMYLNGDENADYATVPVTYNPIALAGSYAGAVSVTEAVTVDADNAMSEIKFGTWEGTLTFYVALNDNPDYVHGNINGGVVMNGTDYASLDEALAAAQGGETIVCTGDVSVSNAITKAVTIDGGNFASLLTVDGVAVTLKNATFTDTEPGAGAHATTAGVPYRYELINGATVTEENNKTILNVGTAAELLAVSYASNSITAEGTYNRNGDPAYNMAGVTINLTANIDLSSVCGTTNPWLPICSFGTNADVGGFQGTFNGNGYTVSNLYSDHNNLTKYGYDLGLFGNAGNGAVFKNVVLDGFVTSEGNSQAGAMVGNTYGNTTFENITVKNCLIRQGRQAGGITGMVNTSATFINCTVMNTALLTIHNDNNGPIYGLLEDGAIVTETNCTITNVVEHKFVKGEVGNDVTEFWATTLEEALVKFADEPASNEN